jgi:RND family efflux transporter MFP subunit
MKTQCEGEPLMILDGAPAASNALRLIGERAVLAVRVPLAWGALLLALVITGCGKKQGAETSSEPQLPVAIVRVQTIEATTRPVIEEVVGTVQPRLQAVVEARLNGRIIAMPVTLGQSVASGEVLVELASQETVARLDQANAALRQAQTDFDRFSRLLAQAAVTRSEFDAVENRFLAAQAAVAEARSHAAEAIITAPFAGVVARKLADMGDLAMPGKPLLELEGKAGHRFVAEVPSTLADMIQPGDKLEVRLEPVSQPIAGTVAEVSPAADPASRTVQVKVDLPDSAGLRAGQFGRVGLPVGESSLVIVSASALVKRGQLDLVFVAAEGRAQLRIVRIGRATAQGMEALAGLKPGELVVVEGAAQLREGQPLEVR